MRPSSFPIVSLRFQPLRLTFQNAQPMLGGIARSGQRLFEEGRFRPIQGDDAMPACRRKSSSSLGRSQGEGAPRRNRPDAGGNGPRVHSDPVTIAARTVGARFQTGGRYRMPTDGSAMTRGSAIPTSERGAES